MAILNISMPGSLAEFVQEEVKANDFSSISEYIRYLIREKKQGKEREGHGF